MTSTASPASAWRHQRNSVLTNSYSFPIRNLSSWQRWEWLEIVDYGRSSLEMPMKQENLELVIVDYPRNFLYWKLNYKQRCSSSAFPTVLLNMFVKVVGNPAIFDDSQYSADYHWLFHAFPMILSVYATDYCLNFENKRTRTHTHTCAHVQALETIYSIIFQLNEVF